VDTASNLKIFLDARSYTPLNSLPHPIGQLIGHVSIPKTFSISSNRSNVSLASRSILLINVKIGICLMTHTLNNLIVCGSTPFDASITMTAQSAAITACFEFAFPLTDPAVLIAPPYKRNFSVSVVLPASGWEIIAKVLLRPISCSMLFAIIFFLFSILSIYSFIFLRILSHIITHL